MKILAIETSCDESAAAVVEYVDSRFSILYSVVASQISVHAAWGGVVPDLASREHVRNLLPVIHETLHQSKLSPQNLDAVAVTSGPGLIPALLVGVETARTLAAVWKKPLIPVNHIEGHIAANWLSNQFISFPAVCLVVSGGHTEIIFLPRFGEYHKLSGTRDDAAGEAFDKVAKLLGLEYPGGPAISRLATQGNPQAISFPRAMMSEKSAMSFSGLKTAVRYEIEAHPDKTSDETYRANVAASFQEAVVDVLVRKTLQAAEAKQAKTVMLTGGVAANKALRERLESDARAAGRDFVVPEPRYCTDNAVMIAAAACLQFDPSKAYPWEEVVADANWELV